MSIRLLLVLPAMVFTVAAYAQQTPIGQVGNAAQANVDALATGAAAVIPHGSAYGLIGSPYVENSWLPARLKMTTGVPLAPVPVKYDVLNHRLLMLPLHRKDSLVLDDRKLASFELDVPARGLQPARVRRFRRFTEAPVLSQRAEYVEVLHEGKYALLKRYAKTLRKANYQGAYSTGERYDEVEDKITYYLLRPDGQLLPVKLGLKPLQAAAPALAAALKAAPEAATAKTDADWGAVLAKVDTQ